MNFAQNFLGALDPHGDFGARARHRETKEGIINALGQPMQPPRASMPKISQNAPQSPKAPMTAPKPQSGPNYDAAKSYAMERGDLDAFFSLEGEQQAQAAQMVDAAGRIAGAGLQKFGSDPSKAADYIRYWGPRFNLSPEQIEQGAANPIVTLQGLAAQSQEFAKIYAENAKQFTLSEGQERFEGGKSIAKVEKTHASVKPTADMQNWRQAVQDGYEGSFVEYQKELKQAGRATTTINTGDAEARTARFLTPKEKQSQGLPVDAVFQFDHNGNVKKVQDSGQTQFFKAKSAMQSMSSTTDLVIGEIDKALEQVTKMTSGLLEPSKMIPGSEARDLKARLDSVKANIGFDKLQSMREQSPTGGALGQVSNMEIELLQAVQGSIDQGQSPEQLREQLANLSGRLKQARSRRQQLFNEQYSGYLDQPQQAQKRRRFNAVTGKVEEIE